MEKTRIDMAFVLLHYLAAEATAACARSVRENIDTDSYRIVIVDNRSGDGSFGRLCKTFKNDRHVICLSNDRNAGYARGNNVGIRHVLKNFSAEFVTVLNNDILLLQKNFYKRVSEEYSKSGFSVMGPMILTADGRCDSSPIRRRIDGRGDVLKILYLERMAYWFDRFYLYFLFQILLKIREKRRTNGKPEETPAFIKYQEDVILHGSFLVFSRNFFEHFQGFDESTFLYHEEEILYVLVKSRGLKTVYVPSVLVFHKEDVSTDAERLRGRKKRLKKEKFCLDSAGELFRIYKENEKRKKEAGTYGGIDGNK